MTSWLAMSNRSSNMARIWNGPNEGTWAGRALLERREGVSAERLSTHQNAVSNFPVMVPDIRREEAVAGNDAHCEPAVSTVTNFLRLRPELTLLLRLGDLLHEARFVQDLGGELDRRDKDPVRAGKAELEDRPYPADM